MPLLAIDCRTGLIRRYVREKSWYTQLKATEFQMTEWPCQGDPRAVLEHLRFTGDA